MSFVEIFAKMGGAVEVVRKRILVKAAQAAGIKIDPECIRWAYRP